jgi:hypothetical protein
LHARPQAWLSLSPFSNHRPPKISYDFLALTDGWLTVCSLFPELFEKEKGCHSITFSIPFSEVILFCHLRGPHFKPSLQVSHHAAKARLVLKHQTNVTSLDRILCQQGLASVLVCAAADEVNYPDRSASSSKSCFSCGKPSSPKYDFNWISVLASRPCHFPARACQNKYAVSPCTWL